VAYLLTQIIFSLSFAALFGAAVGWLLHGIRAANSVDKFKAEYRQQALALSQADTDNKMIEDDFRELKYRSEKTIALLEEDTKQLPELKKNLEKSQTLVRQLLQKHDAELRHLSAENSVLTSKLRELENREKAVTRLQMELNTERLKTRKSDSPKPVVDAAPALAESSGELVNVAPSSLSSANEPNQTSPKQSELVLDADSTDTSDEPEQDTQASFNDVLEKADTVLTRFQDDPDLELRSLQHEIDQELDEIRNDLTLDDLEPLAPIASVAESEADSQQEQKAEPPIFAEATHEDDLQEIFGIGPVTEKTLNSMGIQTFDQIALFEREHIEYVAEVLQIFPGRIERDNWVSGARKLVAEREKDTDPENTTSRELEDA